MNFNKHDSYCIGNVIRIIDERTIIVNVGKDTLQTGAEIQVYELVDTLKNLDGTLLDTYMYIKASLEVVQTAEKYSICRNMETRQKTFPLALSPLLERTIEEYVPLNIDKNDIQPLIPNDPLIRVGDPIKFA